MEWPCSSLFCLDSCPIVDAFYVCLCVSLGAETFSIDASVPSLRIFPGVTEIVGAAGCGKTQLCLQLAVLCHVSADYNGLAGKCLWIDTEGTFSPSRLIEIAQGRFPSLFQSAASLKDLANSVTVASCTSSAKLLELIQSLEETIIEENVKLVIVDSVANPLRTEFDGNHLLQRQDLLGKIASHLKYEGCRLCCSCFPR